MQVRAGRAAGVADEAYEFALGHPRARLDASLGVVLDESPWRLCSTRPA
jgi:hypothetical protein